MMALEEHLEFDDELELEDEVAGGVGQDCDCEDTHHKHHHHHHGGCRPVRAGPAHQVDVNKQESSVHMSKWTPEAMTRRKRLPKEVGENQGAIEDNCLKNLLAIQEFEHKFVVLARRWRRFMNFYGLIEDVNLLLVDGKSKESARASETGAPKSRRLERMPALRFNFQTNNWPLQRNEQCNWLEPMHKHLWLLMIACANLITVYMLIAHFAWELHRLDAKITTAVASANDTQQAIVVVAGRNPQLATFNGWSLLKDFIENLRRHLSRFFALVLILIWHKNCHKFERLFVDCRRYYAAFYPKLSSLAMSELWRKHAAPLIEGYAARRETEPEVGCRKADESVQGNRRVRLLLSIEKFQLQQIEAESCFYKLAWKRITFSVWFPFAHLLFNIVGIFLAPNALILANNGQPVTPQSQPTAYSNAHTTTTTTSGLTDRLFSNFETFHMAVHTAFHPYEHQISGPSGDEMAPPPIAPIRSALYCLAELFVHYIFVNGPRIVCATCLSLVLAIHRQCLCAFNKHLSKLIKRGRESPLSCWEMVRLLKQYDMIGMMHERIESTFKWSLVSWFTLMFLSCLMLIFTLTESTSAAFSEPVGVAPVASPSSQPVSAPHILETICQVAIMLARILFVCYAPILIYAESFKIERESLRSTQLIMLLARRQDDPVAQAIEPGLFGPIKLSAGGFFQLSKRSVAPLLGAIVTFSIMFIGSPDEKLADRKRPPWPLTGALGPDDDARTTTQEQEDDARDEDADEDDEQRDLEQEEDEEKEEDEDEDDDQDEDDDDELPDDAAVRPGARWLHQAHMQHTLSEQETFATTAPKLMTGERKPGNGRHAQHAQMSLSVADGDLKARLWRKYRRLNRKIESGQSQLGAIGPYEHSSAALGSQGSAKQTTSSLTTTKTTTTTTTTTTANQVDGDPQGARQMNGPDELQLTRATRPRLASFYLARLRENERQLSFAPKLRVENQIEICDFELLAQSGARGPGENAPKTQTPRALGQDGRPPGAPASGLFAVTWIDRMSGEIAIEATNLTLINCERQRNYTLGMRAIACNGLESNEATLRIELEDVNEFGPEFERSHYSVSVDSLELKAKRLKFLADDHDVTDDERANKQQSDEPGSWCHLLTVRAHDQDCSRELGQVCRYELVADSRRLNTSSADGFQQPSATTSVGSNMRVDARGNLKARCKWLLGEAEETTPATSSFLFQVVAFDCGGKKSQLPAIVQLEIKHRRLAAQHQQASTQRGMKRETLNETGATEQVPCRPGWKDVDTQIAYKPSSGEHWPFLRAKLDLCSIKCHRPLNITVGLQLEATPPQSDGESAASNQSGPIRRHHPTPVFHCDRDPYAMVSKRRLCGARRKTLELLPPLSAHTRWIGPLVWRHTATADATTAGRGPRRHNRRPVTSAKVLQVFAPVQTNLTESSGNMDANAVASLQADELQLNLDDEQEEEGDDVEEVERRARVDVSAAGPMRLTTSEDEENLGAYLPDGSYGQLAREFAAHERQSTANDAGWAKSTALPARTSGHGDDDRKQHGGRQTRASERAEHYSLRKSAIYRDQVYHFDGVNDALLVPNYVYTNAGAQQHLDYLPSPANRTNGLLFGLRHTLSFWMRHGEFKFTQQQQQQQQHRRRWGRRANESEQLQQQDELLELNRHVREHLLCVSERRHSPESRRQLPVPSHKHQHQHHSKHYAIYMKNCKLNLLIRRQVRDEREAQAEDEPHEWRWSLDQTGQFCDNKWHLYTINVNYPQVELYVDGQQFDTEKKLVAASSSRSVAQMETTASDTGASSTVLTLAACWDARSRSMVGHFRGALSGLNVRSDGNDEAGSIECLGRCTESLVSSAPQNDQQRAPPVRHDNSLVAYQDAQDRIQLRGHDPLDLEDALAQLAYVNRRQLPSIGRRTIHVETKLSCHLAGGGTAAPGAAAAGPSSQLTVQAIPVDLLRIDVNVLPSTSLPVISLAGTPNLAREHPPFIRGQVAPFESIKLNVKQMSLLDVGKPPPAAPKRQRQVSGRMALRSNQFTADLLDYIDDATLNLQHQQPVTPDGATAASVSLEASQDLANSRSRIESCHIQVSPPLDESHESLVLPHAELKRLELYWRQTSSGAVIYGLDSVLNYESLLRMILYRNERPAAYEQRLFRLACSDMSGRLLSNEHHQRLTVIHPRPALAGGDGGGDDDDAGNVPLDDSIYAANETNYFSSLRLSTGPHLTIASEQVADLRGQQPLVSKNKLDRVAMAFLVFVVSLILIVLVIALTNLRETSESAGKRRNKSMNSRRLKKPKDCPRLKRPNVFEIRHQCLNTNTSYTDEEHSNMARANCYNEQDVIIEHQELYTSDEEESIERERQDTYDDDDDDYEEGDLMTQYDEQDQMYDFDVQLTNPNSAKRAPLTTPLSPPLSSADLDSLSWDDELTCAHHHHQRHHHSHGTPPAAATIVINPLAHAHTGAANAPFARRTLVASLKRADTKLGNTRPESHLAIEPAKTSENANAERASSLISGEESIDSESEQSIETMDARSLNENDDDDDDHLLALDDDDLASSLCSHSRSCSLTSLASQGAEMTAPEELGAPHDPTDTEQEYLALRYHDSRARTCAHSTIARHRSISGSHLDEQQQRAAPALQSTYEIYHQHHHRCLREGGARWQRQ